MLDGHGRYLPVLFFMVVQSSKRRRCHHPDCGAPTFPAKGAATVSESPDIARGSAASRRGAGPNTTCALARGSYSELWHMHLRTFLSVPSPFTQAVTGHPACEQIAE